MLTHALATEREAGSRSHMHTHRYARACRGRPAYPTLPSRRVKEPITPAMAA
jgi:hypothetical protein